MPEEVFNKEEFKKDVQSILADFRAFHSKHKTYGKKYENLHKEIEEIWDTDEDLLNADAEFKLLLEDIN